MCRPDLILPGIDFSLEEFDQIWRQLCQQCQLPIEQLHNLFASIVEKTGLHPSFSMMVLDHLVQNKWHLHGPKELSRRLLGWLYSDQFLAAVGNTHGVLR